MMGLQNGVTDRSHASTLAPLLTPQGVVIMGASAAPNKLGAVMERALRRYAGSLGLVNARKPDAALNHHASAVDAAIDAGVTFDLAVLCVPAAHADRALEDAALAGARAAIVCAGGFAESGRDGALHQDRLLAAARDHHVRLLGPNTSGFFVPHTQLYASFVPAVQQLSSGPVAIVAASGGINHALSFLLAEIGVGISYGVGIGLGIDVDAADLLEFLADDPATGVVVLHVEAVTDGPALLRAARRVALRKPLVALVVGEHDVAGFAASHTGALATSWRTTRSLLRQAGAVLVGDERELVDAVAALVHVELLPSAEPGIGLVTAQAGPGLMILDRLKAGRVLVPPLGARTRAAISELLPPMMYQENPVDTGRPGPTQSEVVVQVARDTAIDLVAVYALEEPDSFDLAEAMIDAKARAGEPLMLAVGGAGEEVEALRMRLRARGFATYEGPTGLANGVTAVVERARASTRLRAAGTAGAVPDHADVPPVASPVTFGSAEVRAVLRTGPLDENAAKSLLERLGMRGLARAACTTRSEAHAFLAKVGRSVGVKILDAAVTHKSDIGGVILGISTTGELDGALDRLEAIGATRFLIEVMAEPGVDLLLGAHDDPVFGPVVMLGIGGVRAEVFADFSLRAADLGPGDVAAMVEELQGVALLRGFRGLPPVDVEELAHAAGVVGGLLREHAELEVVEINPLRITMDGLVMLDAVILERRRGDGS